MIRNIMVENIPNLNVETKKKKKRKRNCLIEKGFNTIKVKIRIDLNQN